MREHIVIDKIRSAYDENINMRVTNGDFEHTKTKQALIDDADINRIIKRHGLTKLTQELHGLEAVYGEINAEDLLDAHKKINQANELFMQVPSAIRKQFDNDAGRFIDFATNPENIKQMREWRLAPPERPLEPTPAPEPTPTPEPTPATEPTPD